MCARKAHVIHCVYMFLQFGVSRHRNEVVELDGNESVPIQLAQCWFPGLAISDAKM